MLVCSSTIAFTTCPTIWCVNSVAYLPLKISICVIHRWVNGLLRLPYLGTVSLTAFQSDLLPRWPDTPLLFHLLLPYLAPSRKHLMCGDLLRPAPVPPTSPTCDFTQISFAVAVKDKCNLVERKQNRSQILICDHTVVTISIVTISVVTISVMTVLAVTISAKTISGTCWSTLYTTCVLLPTVKEVWKAKKGQKIKSGPKELRLPGNPYPSTSDMVQNQNNMICDFQMRMQRICKGIYANAFKIGASYILLFVVTLNPLFQFYTTGRWRYPLYQMLLLKTMKYN